MHRVVCLACLIAVPVDAVGRPGRDRPVFEQPAAPGAGDLRGHIGRRQPARRGDPADQAAGLSRRPPAHRRGGHDHLLGVRLQREPGFGTATRITCADGVASPGLINVHDHINWGDSAPVDHGTERFDHRHDWRQGSARPHRADHPLVHQLHRGRTWTELRHLLVGTTSMAGSGSAPLFVRNLDSHRRPRWARRAAVRLLDLSPRRCGRNDARRQLRLPELSTRPFRGEIYLPHVAEGIDPEARNEFLCLSDDTLPGGVNVIEDAALVHAVGLLPSDGETHHSESRLVGVGSADQHLAVWHDRAGDGVRGTSASTSPSAPTGSPRARQTSCAS